MKQQYTLPSHNVDNAFYPQNRDPYKVIEVVTLYKGELVRPIRARFYRSTTGGTYWCSIWTHTATRNGQKLQTLLDLTKALGYRGKTILTGV